MAHLYQRGKRKTWYAKYYQGGRQVLRSLKTSNYRIAREKARLLEAGVDPHEATGSASPRNHVRLCEALEEFCSYLCGIRTESSYRNERIRLRRIFGDICPRLHYVRNSRAQERTKIEAEFLDEITTTHVNVFLEHRRSREHVSPATQLRDREILHKFFTWASGHYGIDWNPVRQTSRPVVNAPIIRFLERDDIARQLGVLESKPQLKAMVAVLIFAGLRREELLWLTHDDIDLDRNMIYVRAKSVDGEHWQPKTKRNRAVPISRSLLAILRDYTSDKRSVWFFSSASGNRIHPATFSRHVSSINTRSGLDWTCLDFRHTFGSQLAKRGISLYKISTLMGNSPEICRRHYAAIRTEHLHDDVEFG